MLRRAAGGISISVKAVMVGILGLSVAGCASDKFVGRPGLQLSADGNLPAPTQNDLILQQRSYVVGPYDKVAIEVYNVPELTRTVQVDAGGGISLPLVGTFTATGLTPNQIATHIAAALKGRYVRDPQVIVNTDTVSQVLTVDGEVRKPGQYPVQGRLTLIGAIARSEGGSDYANLSYVTVFRRVNNQPMAALYDVRAIRQGMYPDPEVFANDTIVVGESSSRRTFQLLAQSSGILVAPLVALLNR